MTDSKEKNLTHKQYNQTYDNDIQTKLLEKNLHWYTNLNM